MADIDTDSFDTTSLKSELAKKSARSGAATFAGQGAAFVIYLGTTAVLARLLVPSDFGLLAMVGPIVAFAGLFAQGGLSQATVQRAELSHAQVSTLFWINVVLGFVLCLLTAGIAPLAARFYGQPEITGITVVLATTLIISGLGVQQSALLRRHMRFEILALIKVISAIGGAGAAIATAYFSRSYWALVVQHLCALTITTALVWVFARWMPGRPRRGSGVRSLLTFGANVTASGFLAYTVRHVDKILIGWLSGPASLGLYSKAYGLLMLPIQQINWPMGSVAHPALSRLQDDPQRFRSYYRTAMSLMVSASMPLVTFALAVTEDLVLLVLGSQWSEVVPLFRALGLAAFLGTFNVATGWALLPLGLADKEFRAGIFGAIVSISAFAIGAQWGALGVALAFSASELIKRPIQIAYAYKFTPISFKDLWSALWRPMVASSVAGLALLAGQESWATLPLVARLAVAGTVFSAIYSVTLWLVPGGRELWSRIISTARYLHPRG
jgi:O-antigen/teichoic acid export membrane protein